MQKSTNHRTMPAPRTSITRNATFLFFLMCAAAFSSMVASAQTGYTGIFGGGPLYKHVASNITEIENSGFTEVIVWSIEVSSTGDLNFNGEFPLTSNGAYIGNQTYPNFATDLATMKQGKVKRVTFSIGSSNVGDWQNIKALVNAQGTGTSSILYKDFQALKAAIPSLDAIDFDDENSQDLASTVQFGVMLGNLGYHVMPDAYDNSSYWTSVVSQTNSQLANTVDGVHLQTYSGGSGNSPCSGWSFGSVPVFPGLWDQNDTPSQVQSTMSGWRSQCGIVGGFMWLYDDFVGNGLATQYASAINTAVSQGGGSSGAYNVNGIYTDGTSFSTGGLDGSGYAYSSNLLGSSLVWNGSSFTFGSANSADAWSNTTITLPSGQYGALNLLASGVNGNQVAQTFTVNYTDGTSTTVTQSLSDWLSPQSYTGESQAMQMAYRDTSAGGKDSRTFHLYGYSFPIDSSKTVKSLTLPSNRDVVVLAFALSMGSSNLGTPVNLSSSFDRIGIYTDGTTFPATGGIDGVGDAYSSNLLGTSLTWNGATFNFGPPNLSNDVSAGDQTITLPAGSFSSLQMLAIAINGNQTAQTFTVTYSDGTTSSFSQSLSDWFSPQNYTGESKAATMSYRDTSSGGTDSRTFYLYGYPFLLNKAKTVASVTLPSNSSVQVLAITLVP
jgi:hypothetical protein